MIARLRRRAVPVTCAAALAVSLTACRTVGPNYQKPAEPMTAHWDIPAPWRPSDPKDAIPKGEWWKVFHDPQLDAYESQAVAANQSLAAAAARYEQARALASVALAGLYPKAEVDPAIARQRLSGERPGNPTPDVATTQSAVTVPFTVSYEVDLFGRRRRSIEAAAASLQSSAADLENARLVIAAELASDYFLVQQLDRELVILTGTVDALQRGLTVVRARRDGGIASGLDVAQEETLLRSTQTEATLARRDRDAFEHAIADLVGQPAPDFHVPAQPLVAEPPALDVALPSDLLERRPDIGSAERAMAEANAEIGVAVSAYYPSLNVFGTGGWQSTALGSIFGAASTLWAVGASAAQTIFNGGETKARVKFAEASYTERVADYRESVLNAMREVQDSISGLGVLSEARTSQTDAVAAAQRALDIATTRYQGGITNYLDVVAAQEALLSAERLLAQIRGEQLVTSVTLVKALGGGWDRASLDQVKIRAESTKTPR